MGPTRKLIGTLLVLLVPAGVGIVTLHASPTCERYVRTYVTVPVRNKVSKTTALAWAKWRKAHPNWKPNPNVHRPRYKMSRREQIEKVAFACQVPTDPQMEDVLFTPSDLNPPPLDISMPSEPILPPIEIADMVVPGDLPPMVPHEPPYSQTIFPPVLTPPFLPPVFASVPIGNSSAVIPPVIPPVAVLPEPSSWALFGTGMMALMLLRRRIAAAA